MYVDGSYIHIEKKRHVTGDRRGFETPSSVNAAVQSTFKPRHRLRTQQHLRITTLRPTDRLLSIYTMVWKN
jgi:hypothetical protein